MYFWSIWVATTGLVGSAFFLRLPFLANVNFFFGRAVSFCKLYASLNEFNFCWYWEKKVEGMANV